MGKLIIIAGGYGSGKTTLVKNIMELNPIGVYHMDLDKYKEDLYDSLGFDNLEEKDKVKKLAFKNFYNDLEDRIRLLKENETLIIDYPFRNNREKEILESLLTDKVSNLDILIVNLKGKPEELYNRAVERDTKSGTDRHIGHLSRTYKDKISNVKADKVTGIRINNPIVSLDDYIKLYNSSQFGEFHLDNIDCEYIEFNTSPDTVLYSDLDIVEYQRYMALRIDKFIHPEYRKVLALDFDGVIVDLDDFLNVCGIEYFQLKEVPNPDGIDLKSKFNVSREVEVNFWKKYSSLYYSTYSTCYKFLENFKKITSSNRFKVICITNRINHTLGNTQADKERDKKRTFEYLNHFNITGIEHVEFNEYKTKLYACIKYGVDTIIEDTKENAKELKEFGVDSILLSYNHNKDFDCEYKVKDWEHCSTRLLAKSFK